MLLHHFASTWHLIAQEDGSHPGAGLTAIQTFLIFIGAPVALFTLISVITYAATAERKKKPASLTYIE
jgi:hypothetical protein